MTTPQRALLIERVTALASQLEKRAAEVDAQGVSAEQFAAIAATGLFNAPLDIAANMEAGRVLAQACGASAWLATAFAEAAEDAAIIDADIAADAMIVSAGSPDSVSLRANGDDHVLTGVWPAVGGVGHAQWLLLSDIVGEGGTYRALVDVRDIGVERYSYLGGLRGAGWHRVTVHELRVPAERLVPEARFPFREPAIALGAVLGMAQGIYDDYTRVTRSRISGIGGQAVARFTQVQTRLAESHAELKACRALYEDVLERIDNGGQDDYARAESRRDQAYIARQSLAAAHRLLSQMGAMGLSETNPVQRRYRDLRALASGPSFHWDGHLSGFGRAELGIVEQADAA